MKFLILGSNKSSDFITNKYYFVSNSLEPAIEKFNDTNLRKLFKYCYLIVDFGMGPMENSGHIFKKYTDCDKHEMQLPFLVLAEFNSDVDIFEGRIRHDKIEIEIKGFNHEFHDNIQAVKKFMEWYTNDIKVKMYISYRHKMIKNNNECEEEIKRRVADGIIMNNTYPVPHNTRYRVKELKWEEILEKRMPQIFNFDIKNKKKIKDIDLINISKSKKKAVEV